MRSGLTALGRMTLDGLRWVGGAQMLAQAALADIARRRVRRRETIAQMAVVGFDSAPIVLLTLFSVGMVIALNTARQTVSLGLSGLAPGLVALSLAREMGPVVAAVVVAARVGSAVAAELGSMKITEQIDALRALAVSPVEYLVVPRLLGAVIMLPALTVLGDASGGLGAFVVSAPQGITAQTFVHSVQTVLPASDVFGGLIKAAVFGFIIALVSSHVGLRAQGGAAGVGRATTSAVVISIVLIFLSDYVMTWVLLAVT